MTPQERMKKIEDGIKVQSPHIGDQFLWLFERVKQLESFINKALIYQMGGGDYTEDFFEYVKTEGKNTLKEDPLEKKK